MLEYKEFIESKKEKIQSTGFEVSDNELNSQLFDFQKYLVKKALQRGKCAIFADCGLGKTFIQLEWANQIVKHNNKPVLILCPLAVGRQTILEKEKFNIDCEIKKYELGDSKPQIYISNYEQIDNIDCSIFEGVVIDESGILKCFQGSTKTKIINNFVKTPYKLACTATPSPNDEIELGNHSEFLNVMSSVDMVAKFFTTNKDRIEGNKYRLKKYAVEDFYRWIKSWAIVCSKPSDLGNFDDSHYALPKLNLIEQKIITPKKDNGLLFNETAVNAMDFNEELRRTKKERLEKAVELVNSKPNEQFIIWIKQNEEGDYLKSLLPEAKEVKGSDIVEYKENTLMDFAQGKFRVLITKTKIAQFGLNFQNCHNQIFASLDFSFESLYQAIRRSYRFGQESEVDIYLITTDTMMNVIEAINTKREKFINMREGILKVNEKMQEIELDEMQAPYIDDDFQLYNGDCVELIKNIPDESIDYSFFSPPFGALYVFSNNPNDMSNVKNDDEFYEHFKFLIPELKRVLKQGRLVTLHLMQGTTLKGRDGFFSIKDFRGDIIRLFQKEGFYFHAETMIRKDPKTAAIRTKNHQLMWGTTKKDSSIVRSGLADYLITFRKPGENQVPIKNDIPFDLWCKIAEPVWLDVNESDTLPSQKDMKDEKHITATQLTPIEWLYLMYCNKGETVYSPFNGIGSEGYVAVKTGRKYIGHELKPSYFMQAVENLKKAKELNAQKSVSLF